jgi:hypothetical protein
MTITEPDHDHVWGPLGYGLFGTCRRQCLVAGCNFINALDDPDEWCHECGGQFKIDENGVSNHMSATTPDGIDHDADEDHVAFSLPEEDDE